MSEHTPRDPLAEAEELLSCGCGHSLDYHNGLGCYERLSYEPLVTCPCELGDNRTHAQLLAPRIDAIVAERVAAALNDLADERFDGAVMTNGGFTEAFDAAWKCYQGIIRERAAALTDPRADA